MVTTADLEKLRLLQGHGLVFPVPKEKRVAITSGRDAQGVRLGPLNVNTLPRHAKTRCMGKDTQAMRCTKGSK